jgi:hypothetical protein
MILTPTPLQQLAPSLLLPTHKAPCIGADKEGMDREGSHAQVAALPEEGEFERARRSDASAGSLSISAILELNAGRVLAALASALLSAESGMLVRHCRVLRRHHTKKLNQTISKQHQQLSDDADPWSEDGGANSQLLQFLQALMEGGTVSHMLPPNLIAKRKISDANSTAHGDDLPSANTNVKQERVPCLVIPLSTLQSEASALLKQFDSFSSVSRLAQEEWRKVQRQQSEAVLARARLMVSEKHVLTQCNTLPLPSSAHARRKCQLCAIVYLR